MKRLKSSLCILILVLCTMSFVHPVFPQTYQYDHEWELNLYNPARITIQFAYTNNFTMSAVRTLGGSLWTAETSPVGIDFTAKAVDTFDFTVTLLYGDVTEQVIQVGYWSGTLPPNSEPFRVNKAEVTLHFRLILTEQPKPPTAEEVASQTMLMLHEDIQYYLDQITLLKRDFEANLMTMWIIIGVNAVFGIVALVCSAYVLKSRREEE